MQRSADKIDTAAITRTDIMHIRLSATRGRPLSPEERDKSIAILVKVIDDPGAARRTKIAAARALAALEALDLRDLHHTEKLQHDKGMLDLRAARAEAGLPNDSMLVQVAPVTELPLPPSLQAYRRRILDESTLPAA